MVIMVIMVIVVIMVIMFIHRLVQQKASTKQSRGVFVVVTTPFNSGPLFSISS